MEPPPPPPVIGIIGGIAPPSTVDYYNLLIAGYQARCQGTFPRIVINSLDLDGMLKLVNAEDWPAMTHRLVAEVGRLERAGATIGLLAANTAHVVFDDVQARCRLPLVSIVHAACDAALAQGLGSVGLLGTRFTMEHGFYQRVFTARGLRIVVPGADDLAWVHQRYFGELIYNQFTDSTRAGMVKVIGRMREAARIGAVLLAGTELPLLLRETEVDVPLIDTTQVHVERVLDLVAPPQGIA
ncbi:MAG TPA: amino acid racemase [Gemmatimonadales bacterium]|nr:amino acid racemase [Gemmatimonadales bacterium]